VSVLTTAGGYTFATMALLGMCLFSLALEFWWIEVVFERFPVLREKQVRNDWSANAGSDPGGLKRWAQREIADWVEFGRLPIFASESLAGVDMCVLPGYTALTPRLGRCQYPLLDHPFVRRDIHRVHQDSPRLG
jgi:hypothetical protein